MDEWYSVVAIWEEMEMSLKVLENKLPHFFRGALEEYKKMTSKKSLVDELNIYYSLDELAISVLKLRLKDEYIFYSHALKRLQGQFNEIGMK